MTWCSCCERDLTQLARYLHFPEECFATYWQRFEKSKYVKWPRCSWLVSYIPLGSRNLAYRGSVISRPQLYRYPGTGCYSGQLRYSRLGKPRNRIPKSEYWITRPVIDSRKTVYDLVFLLADKNRLIRNCARETVCFSEIEYISDQDGSLIRPFALGFISELCDLTTLVLIIY